MGYSAIGLRNYWVSAVPGKHGIGESAELYSQEQEKSSLRKTCPSITLSTANVLLKLVCYTCGLATLETRYSSICISF
jgi:hypothetical protein